MIATQGIQHVVSTILFLAACFVLSGAIAYAASRTLRGGNPRKRTLIGSVVGAVCLLITACVVTYRLRHGP
jgi:Na+-driven multidrug efflux pump